MLGIILQRLFFCTPLNQFSCDTNGDFGWSFGRNWKSDWSLKTSNLDVSKAIGKELGLSLPLTMYTSRHSWASIAKSKNVPLSVISEGMGHDSEATTRIYLASLDNMAVDKANSLILKCL